MKILALAALTFPLFAADAPKPPEKPIEAPLTLSQKIALKAVIDQIGPLQSQQQALIAEACRGVGIPDDKLQECRITQDLSKVYWEKPVQAPPASAPKIPATNSFQPPAPKPAEVKPPVEQPQAKK